MENQNKQYIPATKWAKLESSNTNKEIIIAGIQFRNCNFILLNQSLDTNQACPIPNSTYLKHDKQHKNICHRKFNQIAIKIYIKTKV